MRCLSWDWYYRVVAGMCSSIYCTWFMFSEYISKSHSYLLTAFLLGNTFPTCNYLISAISACEFECQVHNISTSTTSNVNLLKWHSNSTSHSAKYLKWEKQIKWEKCILKIKTRLQFRGNVFEFKSVLTLPCWYQCRYPSSELFIKFPSLWRLDAALCSLFMLHSGYNPY